MSGDDLSQAAPSRWASPPARWSYSQLTKLGECPRAWQLQRSDWGESSPKLAPPSLPQLTGTLIHEAVERILKAMALRGLPARGSDAFRAALREVDYVQRLRDGVEAIQDQLSPRGLRPEDRDALDVEALRNKVAALFQQQYGALERRRDAPRLPQAPARGAGSPLERLLAQGVLAEEPLEHPRLALQGVLDVVYLGPEGVVLADFKTGQPREGHQEQLSIYALLWRAVTGRLPDALEVIYVAETRRFPVDAAALDALEARLEAQIASSAAALSERPARAVAGPHCADCPARIYCDLFWRTRLASPPPEEGASVEVALRIEAALGPSAALASTPQGEELRLRVYQDVPLDLREVAVGSLLRLVGARYSAEDDCVDIHRWTRALVLPGPAS
jgi:hypothetical protein